ncbi:MAG: hypothetical protein AAAC47_23125, partial [Pararhizobium sp.]
NRCDKYDFIAALHQNQVESYAAQQSPKTAARWWRVRGAADQIAGYEGRRPENEQRRAGGRRVVVRRPGDRRRLVLDIFSRLSCFGGCGVRLLEFARETGSQIFDIGHHRAPLLREENIPKVILFHQKKRRGCPLLGRMLERCVQTVSSTEDRASSRHEIKAFAEK